MCIVKGQYRQIILAAVCVQFNGIKVFDEWPAEGRKAWTSGSHQTLARPLCVNHSDESWNRLSHVELMDRWGWEQGAADPTPQKHSSSHQCWQYTQTHTHKTREGKKVGIRGEPVIREHFSSLISIACLMRKNTSGFCGQQPSLIILKRNTTPPQLESSTLFSAACRAEPRKPVWKKKGEKKANHALFQSVQSALVNFSVQRFNVSNEHQTSTGLIV